MDKSTALAQAGQRSIWEKVNDPIQAIEKVGKWLAGSGMFGIRNPEQGFVVAITCMEERITPLEFKRRYHIIEGSPAKRADRMHADFVARGGEVNWIESSADAAEALFLHPKRCPKGFRVRVTLEEMRKRGITEGQKGTKANWARFPEDMLAARCLSRGIRRVDPGCVAGEYTPEEISDMDDREYIDARASVVHADSAQQQPTTKTSEQAPDTQEGAEPKTSPAATQEPEPDPEVERQQLQRRAEAVLAAFRPYTITQDDLEAFCGDYETGEIVEMKDWTEVQFAKLTAAHKRIKMAPPEERNGVICTLFNLPSSAMEG